MVLRRAALALLLLAAACSPERGEDEFFAPGGAGTPVVDMGDLPAEFRDSGATTTASDWLAALEQEAERRLARGETGILDALSRQFERSLIQRALARTGGRRIEAANLLGMGRNTITRKIQDLGIEGGEEEK
jgi:two-component system nitrogen regulation response regulator GlnG